MSLGIKDSENFGCVKIEAAGSQCLFLLGIAKLKNQIIPCVLNRKGERVGEVSRT